MSPQKKWALLVAERLVGSGKKCQGTTSVVPKKADNDVGFSP